MRKKYTIVFRLLPEYGHHNATFYFGQQLMEHGYRVVYASVNKMRNHIESNGFEFYEIPKNEDPAMMVHPKYENKLKTFLLRLINIIHERKGMKWAHYIMSNFNYLESVKRDLNPDLLMLDRAYDVLVLNALSLKIKVCQIETTVSTNKTKGIPPFSSYYVPSFSWTSNIITEVLWFNLFLERKLYKHLFGDVESGLKKFAKRIDYPIAKLNSKRFHNIGYDMIPELIMSPEEFDFPHKPAPNQSYGGPSLLRYRNDKQADVTFSNPYKKSDNPLIFCALGSLSFRYKGIERFYKRLIEVFQRHNEYNLILCVDNDGLREKLKGTTAPNISLFKKVPQLALLPDVDLMINHGGMNSITECILNEVPMLIYPGTRQLDQVGNSARVVYHGIGLRGQLKYDGTKSITNKIQKILANPEYKKNLASMKNKIYQRKNFSKGLDLVASLLGVERLETMKEQYIAADSSYE